MTRRATCGRPWATDVHEFMNALVHIAHVKFPAIGSLAESLEALLLEFLLPHAKKNTFYKKELGLVGKKK